MSAPGIGHLPQRAPPPPPRRGTGRWIASEWGLAVIALILAVLVWAIVWGNISKEDSFQSVKLRPLTSARYVAYPEQEEITLRVEGPRRDLEEARARLGSPPVVDMPIDDLEPDQDADRVWLSKVGQLAVPFPTRLLKGLDPAELPVEVLRLKETVVRFTPPVVGGVPRGVDYVIVLEPDSDVIIAPAHKVESDIQPDHMDMSDLFQDQEDGYLPPETTRDLAFDNWRNDPRQRRYRTEVELPPVTATVRFFATEKRELSNPIVFWGPYGPLEGYEVTVSGGLVQTGYYEGSFEGASEDLDRLEEEKASWWYVVRIPGDKLPTDDAETNDNIQVEYVHTEALDGLRVKFTGPVFTVTIKKTP